MPDDNELELMGSHVREAESQIATQRVRIEALRRAGQSTRRSEIILKTYEGTLRMYRECLIALQTAQIELDRETFDEGSGAPKL